MPKPPLSTIIRQAMKEAKDAKLPGMTDAEIASKVQTARREAKTIEGEALLSPEEQVELDRSSFLHWLEDGKGFNSIPLDAIPILDRVFHGRIRQLAAQAGLPDLADVPDDELAAKLEKGYRFLPRKEHKKKKSSLTSGTTVDLLTRIDATYSKVFEALEETAALTNQLYQCMGKDHFFVSTNISVRPLMFDSKADGALKTMIEMREAAIERGALFCIILPTDRLFNCLKETYHIKGDHDPARIRRDFERFRQEMIQRFREGDQPECAEQFAYERFQRFDADELPFTPPGMT